MPRNQMLIKDLTLLLSILPLYMIKKPIKKTTKKYQNFSDYFKDSQFISHIFDLCHNLYH